uniref:Uncharacterized protein n=1 Tax=Triticum urartu TaxID=4572 RepID=A0A8R7QH08_TRIUA
VSSSFFTSAALPSISPEVRVPRRHPSQPPGVRVQRLAVRHLQAVELPTQRCQPCRADPIGADEPHLQGVPYLPGSGLCRHREQHVLRQRSEQQRACRLVLPRVHRRIARRHRLPHGVHVEDGLRLDRPDGVVVHREHRHRHRRRSARATAVRNQRHGHR